MDPMEQRTQTPRRRRRKPRRDPLQYVLVILLILVVCGVLILVAMSLRGLLDPLPTESTPPSTAAASEPTLPTPTTDPGPTLDPASAVIDAFARDHGLTLADYPQALVDMLARNPETEDFVLNYPLEVDKEHSVDLSEYADSETVPLFMQWDPRWGYLKYGSNVAGLTGCGPVCLSMAAYYLTKDPAMSPDRILQFALEGGYCVPGNGTAWTLISQGGRELGLEVQELPLDKNIVFRHVEQGEPVICVVGPGHFTTTGHFIVLVGTEEGKLRVNDPNSRANSQRLWEFEEFQGEIGNLWALRNPE